MPETRPNNTVIIASAITILYILITLFLAIIPSWDATFLDKDGFIKLNDVGDALAGWVAPVAAGWFILAVFLQKQELQETREAFLNQVEETKHTVREMKKAAASEKLRKLEKLNRKDILDKINNYRFHSDKIKNDYPQNPVGYYVVSYNDITFELRVTDINYKKTNQNSQSAYNFLEWLLSILNRIYISVKNEYSEEIAKIVFEESEIGTLKNILNDAFNHSDSLQVF